MKFELKIEKNIRFLFVLYERLLECIIVFDNIFAQFNVTRAALAKNFFH